MRRNHSDAGGRTESSSELIARLTAERQDRSPRATRRRLAAGSGTGATAVIGRSSDAQENDARGDGTSVAVASTTNTHVARTGTDSTEITGGRAARRRAQEAQAAAGGRAARRRAAEDKAEPASTAETSTAPNDAAGAAAEQTRATGGRGARRRAAEDPAERTETTTLPVVDSGVEQTRANPLPVVDGTTDGDVEQIRITGSPGEPTALIGPAEDDPDTEEIPGLPIEDVDGDDKAGTGGTAGPDPSAPTPIRRPTKRTTRRLAPLAVGAAVMLIAASVATFIQSPADDQVAAAELSGVVAAEPPPDLNRLDEVVDPSPEPTPKPNPEPEPAPAPQPSPEPTPEPNPEPEPAPAPVVDVDGTQAAEVLGWTQVKGDEFDGGLDPVWGEYNGAGHGGNGRRSPDHVTVEDDMLVIRGDGNGNTGGVAWRDGQRFGRWEVRARFPAGDAQYHPVLILWPTAENWPEGGEVDFAEATSASDNVAFFLHYSAQNQQAFARKPLDITQWHNYAVEWVNGRITGYVDGEKWFESTDGKTLPPGEMHLTIQLDYFPEGGNPRNTEMHVDWVRIYEA